MAQRRHFTWREGKKNKPFNNDQSVRCRRTALVAEEDNVLDEVEMFTIKTKEMAMMRKTSIPERTSIQKMRKAFAIEENNEKKRRKPEMQEDTA